MDESAILGKKLHLVKIALGFASCNFSVAMKFFPKLHCHPCDYLYEHKCYVKKNVQWQCYSVYGLSVLFYSCYKSVSSHRDQNTS